MSKGVIDLTGQRFERLFVISRSENSKSGASKWNCICDCGKKTIVDSHNLRRGSTRSCGCLDTHGRFTDETMSSKNMLYNRYKKTCAKSRGHLFSIGFEEFITIVQRSCYYCGSPPLRYCIVKSARKGFYYNGLDRVNNNIGYQIDNVVPCCKDCNYAKTDRTKKDFIEWVNQCFHHLSLDCIGEL